MSENDQHPREALQDLLCGRIDSRSRAELEAHVDACTECRRELESLRWVKQVLTGHLERQSAPDALRARVVAALDAEDVAATTAPPPIGFRPWSWAMVGAVPLLLLVALAAVWWLRPADLPRMVADDYGAFKTEVLKLGSLTADGPLLENYFAEQGIEFPTRVFDLGMMNYRLVGGRIHELAGDPSAAFVYRGADGKLLVCQMFRGQPEDLPAGAEVREHNGIEFYI